MNPIDSSHPHDPQGHPTAEAWADYLYGELPPDARARVDEHVQGCSNCRQQAVQWRETMEAMSAWRLPHHRRSMRVLTGYARWAVAACAVLGLGWLGGRVSAPVAPGGDEMLARFGPALSRDLSGQFQAELATALKQAEERTQERLVELAQAWAQAREEDRQSMAALYQQSEQQRRAEAAALRRDLETVAVVAQSAIGATQQRLTQLAANSQVTPTGGGGLPH